MYSTRERREAEEHELRRLAMQYLEAPETVPKAEPLRRWMFRLRLWHYPSFTPMRSWGVYEHRPSPNRPTKLIVRQITWDQSADWERLHQPLVGLVKGFHCAPSIEVRDRPIDSQIFERRLAELRTIKVPVFENGGIGLDGESFGVAMPGSGQELEWWCDGPDSWQSLTAWAAKVRKWLGEVTAVPAAMQA